MSSCNTVEKVLPKRLMNEPDFAWAPHQSYLDLLEQGRRDWQLSEDLGYSALEY